MLALRFGLQRLSASIGARLPPGSAWRPAVGAGLQARGMGTNTTDDGQFKTWKPLAPTLRHRRMASRKDLHKGGPERSLTVAKRRSGGRNNTGRITCRHRGGGAKRRIRLVDFRRSEPGPQQVVRLEYDPGRSAHIALIKHMETGKLSYILAPAGLKPGAVVQSYMAQGLKMQPAKGEAAAAAAAADGAAQKDGAAAPAKEASAGEAEAEAGEAEAGEVPGALDYSSEGLVLKAGDMARPSLEVGNCMPLKLAPMGSIVHNIGLHPFGRGQLARSAGTWAQLLYTAPTGLAQIKLMSGEIRRVPVDACATLGRVSNPNHKHEKLGSAGARRRRGWRPTVRGTAMNTHDHPHGGGRGKSKGNKHPRSPWGKLAKGGKTRRKTSPMVVRGRPRRSQK
ncbi:mitochondrial 54S ribosomal protein rml2 [Coemansia nantahalensis]|uniref:Mitochondrial 54S ribosomal protein rml2 n=1 Tax=Coemansia nantahalensis TaxID=2789366 RepID=A0ACC1JLK7_9FUNG|nr:mitochondrial 54S ribosomal protein rml2 [Coemansia nantahalensis]KAJ2762352.1 mitochondrial 54S ribosomal protein rml2 [Coemansia nantahalensis]